MTTTMLPRVLLILFPCFLQPMMRGSGLNKCSLTTLLQPQPWDYFLGIFLFPVMVPIVSQSLLTKEPPSPSLLLRKTSFQHHFQQMEWFLHGIAKGLMIEGLGMVEWTMPSPNGDPNFLSSPSLLHSKSQSMASQPTTFSPTSNKQK